MTGKIKTVFRCTECGATSLRWAGQCPTCREWNTLVEETIAPVSKNISANRVLLTESELPVLIKNVVSESEIRHSTDLKEMDRVLGGGMVKGSLILLGGDPGIGKSTILLQICQYLCKDLKVLYVSGEESKHQIKLRADRLGVSCDNLLLVTITDILEIASCIESCAPDVVIVDSIQTMSHPQIQSSQGSVVQVRECTSLLMKIAKTQGVTIFIVGHVNKDGAIAGPKVLEHIVDTVLYFEGERNLPYRILRTVKNRFGSTNEIGVFEMSSKGLIEVENPSMMLLSGRPNNVSGSCVTCVMEGSRPLLLELQALVTKSTFSSPRRTANGFDFNRMALLLAVIEKRGGYFLGGLDAYINVVGGFRLDETSADLAVVMAIVSSIKEKPVPEDTVVFGEVGLSGEVRTVTNFEIRIKEAQRLGFKKCVVPKHALTKLDIKNYEIKLMGVSGIRDAIRLIDEWS